MTDRSENGACSMLLELGKRMHLQPTVANVLYIHPTDSTILLRILATRGAAMLICSLLKKSRQQLGHEKMNNLAHMQATLMTSQTWSKGLNSRPHFGDF